MDACNANHLKVCRIESVDKIQWLLSWFDKDFDPPLSVRIKDLNSYAEKLHKYAYVYTIGESYCTKGFVAFYANDYDTSIAYLAQIAVKSDSRGKGIGVKLLRICEKVSAKNGMERIRLEVGLHNQRAIRFYGRNGFEYCGEASPESIYMLKTL